MKLKFYGWLLLVIGLASQGFAQSADCAWFLVPNGNLYLPVNNPNKGVYPILWYDKNTSPKLLIGGLGLGVSFIKPLTSKVSWRAQGNLSKHTYWDELLNLKLPVGVAAGSFGAGSSDYSIGLSSTIHYGLSKRLSVGTGLGGQILLVSLARLPEVQGMIDDQILVNKQYKYLVPVLPVELAFRPSERLLFTIRYEYSLLNRIRGDLSKVKTDKYGLLTFELGFRIR